MLKSRPSFYIVILIGLALVGLILPLFATRFGVGISPNSVVYIGGARSLLEGKGFSTPSVNSHQIRSLTTHLSILFSWPELVYLGSIPSTPPGG